MKKSYKSLLTLSALLLSLNTSVFANDDLLENAKAGDAKAQLEIAELYINGKLGNKSLEDKSKAIDWLEKSSEQGLLNAQETLSELYLTQCKYEKALKWAKTAAEKGSSRAKAVMAVVYYLGVGAAPVDRTKAFSLIKETESEPLSKALLALYYITGWFDFEPDYEKAKSLCKETLNSNFSIGYEVIVLAYIKEFVDTGNSALIPEMMKYSEEGIKKFPDSEDMKMTLPLCLMLNPTEENLNKGRNILKEIKNEGLGAAKYILSQYEMISKNKDKAAEYLLESAELDYYDAIAQAFQLYLYGENELELTTKPDFEKAAKLSKRALNAHNADFLGTFYPMMKIAISDKKYQEDIQDVFLKDFDFDKYLKIAADNGCPSLMYLYSKNRNLPKEERNKYLYGSANMGWVEAMEEIAMNLYNENNENAYSWALKAESKNQLLQQQNKDVVSCKDAYLVQGLCLLKGVCGSKKDINQGLDKITSYIVRGGDVKYSHLLFKEYSALEENPLNIANAYIWGTVNLRVSKDTTGSTKKDIINYLNQAKNKLNKRGIELCENEIESILNSNKTHIKHRILFNITYYGVSRLR